MRLYYIDERESARYHVRSALGVDAERWNDLFRAVRDWRQELRRRYRIPVTVELLPFDLLSPREPAGCEEGDGWVSPEEGVDIFRGGLRLLDDASRRGGGIELINVCLDKQGRGRTDEVSLGRLLTRINTSAAGADRHAFLIFDAVQEEPITRLYRRLRAHNPIPSRYEAWEDGSPTRNIPLDRVIGGPAFRSAEDDHLLQLAGFAAHSLLLQERGVEAVGEDRDLARAFGILDHILNREASRRDPQGVVRR
ncbi:MAG: hypothetical protein OXS47_02530 [Chloroflexota bacterium]|nr:hypothetical protein [Chloroflexota bacterium]